MLYSTEVTGPGWASFYGYSEEYLYSPALVHWLLGGKRDPIPWDAPEISSFFEPMEQLGALQVKWWPVGKPFQLLVFGGREEVVDAFWP